MLPRLLILLWALLPFAVCAQELSLHSGEAYRIECVGVGQGGVVPGRVVDDPSVLLYVTAGVSSDDLLWTIEESGKGPSGQKAYTLRHRTTGLYATYDGQRNDYKRYVELTTKPDGDASRWTFTDRGGSWSIDNVKTPEHHFHTRGSMLVGTYADDVPPGANSRYVLYNAEGQRLSTIEEPEPSLYNQIGTLRINGERAAYDGRTNSYLVTLPEQYRGAKSVSLLVEYNDKNGELEADFISMPSGRKHSFGPFDKGTSIGLVLRTPDGETYEASLAFTYLPVVQLYGYFSPNYNSGQIRVNDADTDGEDELLHMRSHWRGNTSLGRAKKSYAVKLTNAEGESIDRKLLGLRNDNNWVLDAAFIDPSRIRNRVSTDIWNDYRVDPYYAEQEPKARTATRGRMVEVFLNDAYDGIYCMTEKLDRKQLKLKKLQTREEDGFEVIDPTQHGIIYKAVEWDYTSYFGGGHGDFAGVLPSEPSNERDAWGGWEIKYPDLGDGEPIDWTPLYDHVAFMATCTDADFRRQAALRFDLPALRDYYLLQELALAHDNSAKNIYWFIYDAAESTKLSLAPWDFDGTWGRIWNGTTGNSYPDKTLRDFAEQNLSANKIYSMLMRLNLDGWNDKLGERYAELRRAGVFSLESLYARFASYFALMQDSGATLRETDRWDGNSGFALDFDAELPLIRDWIDVHLATLDAFYAYDPITGLSAPTSPAGSQRTINVYSPDGRLVRRIEAQSGQEAEATLRTLPPGVYIIGGRKVKL